jgi:magnesium chelatase family protein
LHIEVPSVPYQELAAAADGTNSARMRDMVQKARQRQADRFHGRGLNSQMSSRQLRKYTSLNDESQRLLRTAMEDLGLSARAHDRILKMARTIADLDDAESIRVEHLSEAIGYRSLDRRLWAK